MESNFSIGKIISLATAVLVLAGLVLWGVPSYIKVQVTNQVTAELKERDVAASAASAKSLAEKNEAALEAFGGQLSSMEDRMIARDEWLKGYLERQANRQPVR